MNSSKPTLRPRSPVPPSRFLTIGISPGIGPIICTTIREVGKRPRTIFQSTRDKELADARELHRQQQLVEHKKRSERVAASSEYSTALDIKECLLQVQKLCLKDLAVEENHIKFFAQLPHATTIDLEKSHREVGRVVNALHCRERRL